MSFFSTQNSDFDQLFAENLNELKTENNAKIEANNAKRAQVDLFPDLKKKLDYTAVKYDFIKPKIAKMTDFTKNILDLIIDAISKKNDLRSFKQAYFKLNDYWPVITLIFGNELYDFFAIIFHGTNQELSKELRNWLFLFQNNFENAMQLKLSIKIEDVESMNKFKIFEIEKKNDLIIDYSIKPKVDYSCDLPKNKIDFKTGIVKSLKLLEKDEIKTSVAVLDIEEKTKLAKKVKAHFSYLAPADYKKIILFLKNNLKINNGSICEILVDNVRFFCDIDDKENIMTKESFISHCKLIVDNFEKCFVDFFSQFPEFNESTVFSVKPIALFPKIWKYNSCHLIFDVCANGIPICFADASQQKMFWMSFLFIFPELKDIFDLSVYSKNRYMRFPYSYKNGQYLAPLDLICTNGKLLTKDLFICLDTEKKIRLDHPCDFSSKPKYWTEFEKRELLRNIRNCDKSIKKKKDWLFLISTICSAFKEESLEFCQELVIKICIAGGFSSEEDIKENIETVAIYYGRKPNTSFLKSIEFFAANCNFDVVDVFDKIDYMTFPKAEKETVLVKSGCNTQKTYNFMQNHRTSTFFITHRCSLAEDYFTTFEGLKIKAVHYKNYNEQKNIYFQLIESGQIEEAAKMGIPNEKDLFIPINFVCQLNSIYKFFDIMPFFDRFFFDECAATFKMINFCIDNGKKGSSIYFKTAFDYILNNKSIFCVSANLGYETFNLLEYYGRKITFSLNNMKLDKSEFHYELYEDKKEFLSVVDGFVNEGKKVIMPCNNLKLATQFQEHIIKKGKKALIISKYSKLIETDQWRYYDVVLMTPKIDSGVSYMGYYEKTDDKTEEVLNGHFDKICGYFEKGINDSESCFQSLWRARNPKNKDIHLFISTTFGLQGEEWDKEENVLKQYYLIKDDLKPIDKLYLDNIYFKNHDRYYFFQNLKKMLDKTGMVNVTHKRAKTIEKKTTDIVKGKKVTVTVKEKLPSELIIGNKKMMHKLEDLSFGKTSALNCHKMTLIEEKDSTIFKELDSFFKQYNPHFSADLLPFDEIRENEDPKKYSEKHALQAQIKNTIRENTSDISSKMQKFINRIKIKSINKLNYKRFLKAFILANERPSDEDKKKKNEGKINKIMKKHYDLLLKKKMDEFEGERRDLYESDLKKEIEKKTLLDFFAPYRVILENDKYKQILDITPQDLFIAKAYRFICKEDKKRKEALERRRIRLQECIEKKIEFVEEETVSFEKRVIGFFIDRFTEFNNLFPNSHKKTLKAFESAKLHHQVSYISFKFDKYNLLFSCDKGNIKLREASEESNELCLVVFSALTDLLKLKKESNDKLYN